MRTVKSISDSDFDVAVVVGDAPPLDGQEWDTQVKTVFEWCPHACFIAVNRAAGKMQHIVPPHAIVSFHILWMKNYLADTDMIRMPEMWSTRLARGGGVKSFTPRYAGGSSSLIAVQLALQVLKAPRVVVANVRLDASGYEKYAEQWRICSLDKTMFDLQEQVRFVDGPMLKWFRQATKEWANGQDGADQ